MKIVRIRQGKLRPAGVAGGALHAVNKYGNGVVHVEEKLPAYSGGYSVTPQNKQAKTLETSGKKMNNNITVEPIRVTTYSNAGGTSVRIG